MNYTKTIDLLNNYNFDITCYEDLRNERNSDFKDLVKAINDDDGLYESHISELIKESGWSIYDEADAKKISLLFRYRYRLNKLKVFYRGMASPSYIIDNRPADLDSHAMVRLLNIYNYYTKSTDDNLLTLHGIINDKGYCGEMNPVAGYCKCGIKNPKLNNMNHMRGVFFANKPTAGRADLFAWLERYRKGNPIFENEQLILDYKKRLENVSKEYLSGILSDSSINLEKSYQWSKIPYLCQLSKSVRKEQFESYIHEIAAYDGDAYPAMAFLIREDVQSFLLEKTEDEMNKINASFMVLPNDFRNAIFNYRLSRQFE